MPELKHFRFIPDAYRGEQFKPTIILLTALFLSITWWFYGTAEFYREAIGPSLSLPTTEKASVLYHFAASFLLFGAIPTFVIKFVLRENLSDFGVQLGDWKQSLISYAALAPLFVLFAYLGSTNPVVRDLFPMDKGAAESKAAFGVYAATYLLLVVSFEFHYRGYVQFGLRDSLGPTNALLVQVATSAMVHLGFTPSQAFGSVFCGVLWGTIAFRTRSILSSLLLHATLAVTLDWLICFGPGSGGTS